MVSCKVCGNTNLIKIGSKDLTKGCLETSPFIPSGILIEYYTCKHCGLTFTTYFDNWSDKRWKDVIYNDKYVDYDPEYLEVRPRANLLAIPNLIKGLGLKVTTKLDYGSGVGISAKEFGAVAYDPHSSPKRPQGTFSFITCFEVAEHHVNPISLFKDLVSLLDTNGVLLISTLALNRPAIDNWYIGPRNGHITFYNKKTLTTLANMVGLKYSCLNNNIHLFLKE